MKCLLIAFIAFLPSLSFADVTAEIKKIETKTQACFDDDQNLTTLGMEFCAKEGYEAMDQLLNKVYSEVVRDLKKPTGDEYLDQEAAEILRRLVVSQRAWIEFRDANSAFHGTVMLNGNAENLVKNATLSEMTKSRILEIDEVINSNN